MDELYVVARRVLLDALDALGSHRDAIVVVGANAVYMRVGEADLAVAPHTTDGDLAIDPARLSDIPPLAALEPSDTRVFEMRVAGPAALLVAKVHKIQDRAGTARATDKDALDILRILRGTSTSDLSARMKRVLDEDNARPVAEEAIDLLRQQFGDRAGEGIQMAVRAAFALENAEEIAASCELLANDLLREVSR